MIKVRAVKVPDGRFELFLEPSPIELPVLYSDENIKTLEENGVISGRNSYNAGTTVEFRLNYKLSKEIEESILNAVTERKN